MYVDMCPHLVQWKTKHSLDAQRTGSFYWAARSMGWEVRELTILDSGADGLINMACDQEPFNISVHRIGSTNQLTSFNSIQSTKYGLGWVKIDYIILGFS